MKYFKHLIIYLLCLFSSATFARYIYVDISNKTNGSCMLVDQHRLNGIQDGTIPSNIDKNSTQTFIMFQSLSRGPHIELRYSCNNKLIQFSCKQDSTLLGYGHLHADLLSAQDGITAAFDTVDPTRSQTGRIYITLIEN